MSVDSTGSGKLNLTTTYTYDTTGNLTKIDGPRSDVADKTYFTYSADRQPKIITDALGKQTRNYYDDDGRLLRSAAQFGTQWLISCRQYTNSGKLKKAWGPALTTETDKCPSTASPDAVTDYAYDNLDRLQQITQRLSADQGGSRITQIAYYPDDQMQWIKRAVGNSKEQLYATYTYTPNGAVATIKDAKNNLTTYQYDGRDRKSKTFFPDKLTANTSSATDYEQYGYDENGNLLSLRKRDGSLITYQYDNLNRLTALLYPNTADQVAYTYDLLGRRKSANIAGVPSSFSYDNAGRLLSLSSAGKSIAYQYDPAGNRTRITYPETSFFVTYSYDALNRPATIKETDTVALATYNYDDLSRRTTVTLGNGTSTTYGYNNQGNLASIAHDLAGTAQDVTYSYTRNQAQQIANQAWSNDAYQWNGAANGSTNYSVNGLNQYTKVASSHLDRDANGNLIGDGVWTYTYDAANRLRSANKTGTSASFAYDPLGRLRTSTLNGVATQLFYDGTDLIAEYDSTATTLLRRYVHGPGVDEPIVVYEGAGTANKSWLYADHLGSVIATADAAGNSTSTLSYGPYGEPNQSTGVRFRYTGQQFFGPLNLYYYKARFYSPALGRFLQTDPIGYEDDMNLYAYVGNDPVNNTDPDGTYAEIKVNGNRVNINFPVQFTGSSATPNAIKAYTDQIQNAWSGNFGKYNVTLSVTTPSSGTPRSNYNVIEIGPLDPNVAGGRPYTNQLGGNYIKLGPLGQGSSATDQYRTWTAGHEAGHAMDLLDMYDYGTGNPYPGFEHNIMGAAGQTASEQDISNILYYQTPGNGGISGPNAAQSPISSGGSWWK